ncbi:MAG: hypothetical protein ACD_46C00455G0002 [uncultured bacterium]|nr:MAG: hypothetical protein ACD_46C00455G0002 [uncultured bacterium]OGT56648.1 MAG: hypothetical protein A3F43_04900 [Gammaproteobacteria bacterium RIFCSPHIGHO2_12_FULL_42_10]
MVTAKKIKKITVRFSKRLQQEMQTNLVQLGYGLRGKSRWLKDTINRFLNKNNYIDYVEQGVALNQAELTEIEAFYLDETIIYKIQAAFIQIRKQHPLFEGVQSALIRSAIIYQLMLK